MARFSRPRGSVVGVEGGVEATPGAGAWSRLDRAGLAVAPEHHVAHAGQVACLDDLAVRQPDLRPGRHVAPGLDDTVVAEGDADAGVGAEQTALAERDHDLPTTGERAHHRGAATDISAVTDDHAG